MLVKKFFDFYNEGNYDDAAVVILLVLFKYFLNILYLNNLWLNL
jgi:hypothetical protein